MKNVQILDCPSASEISRNGANSIAYGRNTTVNPVIPNTTIADINNPATLASMEAPAETILLGDNAFRQLAGAEINQIGRARVMRAPSAAATLQPPTAHGLHAGFCNIAWYDGHVKAMKPTPRTVAMSGTADNIEWHKNNNMGDILKPGCPVGSPCEDYYFTAAKPTN